MAAVASPTLTSTSHTLTALPPGMAPATTNSTPNGETHLLLEALRPANRHGFLQPQPAIPAESLRLVKDTLEGFAAQVGEEQERRLKESRKRKRAGGDKGRDEIDVLKLRKVYVDGFETGQVWQQAKKIIGGVLDFSEGVLDELEEANEIAVDAQGEGEAEPKSITFGEDGFEVDSGEDEDEEESGSQLEEDDEDEEESGDEEDLEALEGELEDEDDQDAPEDLEDDGEDDEDEKEYVQDPHGLNDGFFSIDDFNKQTQWFEDQDTRGDPTTDQASDDEAINWEADPLAPSKGDTKSSKRKSADDEAGDDDDDDDDEDGPTFGDMSLDAPEGESDEEGVDEDLEDESGDMNANEVYYKDFFAPPPRKSRGDRPRKSVKFDAPAQAPAEEDVERAMADVRRDLFDDESDVEGSEDDLSEVDAGDPKSRRSALERRQAKLAEEIRKLEAASVAKREWALSGEAQAADRPMNSLLEEDLDFEHVGKPVPVITPEVSEGIEELIKRRILAQEFDEVLRRRPDAESVPQGTRRGALAEIDDSRPEKGLAEVYEEEHIKKTDPDAYVSKSDEKLQREEKEIEAMWRDVSSRLDALSSWHYRPKPAAPAISVVADVATIAMEDAQPATAQAVAGESSRMAPQEVYKPGAAAANGDKGATPRDEVVTKGGMPLARAEMSREDRTRRRRRHKERVRKAGGGASAPASATPGAAAGRGGGAKGTATRAQSQRETVAELKRGGVKVINRKGEITDVDGNKAKAAKAASSGSYKL
ncbi:U3 snoRNP protein [Purpureocillium takamizusanense]|uniref:U3 small nucleolar ribonucleoprotein protein MPP10 n=1 Tax=Purpureocillium takamizusanense TaxID=2060973 RepID=A0A9Q8V895_9HYPO|nr:U3 snoRNP protein [Purpureocillium takamizusanense]UNI15649.1 U3 snoRNP protein [Purpureocillium takamizusanense]